MADREWSACLDASIEERPQSGRAFRRTRGGDVRRRLCRAAGTARADRGDADAVPQEAASGSAERGQRAMAKPRGAPALRYAADRAARCGDAAATADRG